MCGTDNVDIVSEKLGAFSDEEWCALWEVVGLCVGDSQYPHHTTMWPYNSPQVALDRCRVAADAQHELSQQARADIIDSAMLHKETFPFIEVPFFTMDEDTVYVPARENAPHPTDVEDPPLLPFLMPTLAIGSILMLAKNKMSEECI